MKAMTKILSICVCLALVAGCLCFSASAADVASITVQDQSGTNATVTGKELRLFQIFKATTNKDGNIAYEWIVDGNETDGYTNRYESFFFGDDTVDPSFPNLIGKDVKDSSILDVVDYINSLKDDSFLFSQMAANLHEYIHAKSITPLDTSGVIPAGSTSYTFDNEGKGLELGYYMIYDATTIAEGSPAVRSAAMLAHPGENKVIELKADRPHIEKYVNDGNSEDDWKLGTTANIGDTVNFRIVTAVPDHDLYGDEYTFIITDKMDSTLSLDADSIEVVATDTSGSALDTLDYTLETDAADLDEGETFEITFNNITTLEKDTEIEVLYTATVTNKAALSNNNTAILTYSNDPNSTDGSYGTDEKSVAVRLWQLTLTKHIDGSSKRIGGAQFQIFDKNNPTVPLTFSTETVKGTNTVTNGEVEFTKYTFDPEGTETTLKTLDGGTNVDDGQTNIDYTNGGHLGQIFIYGLGEGTYIIRETDAPDGYEQAPGDFEFTVTDSIGSAGAVDNATISQVRDTNLSGQFTRVSINEINQSYYIGITNVPGSELPETGGIGTTLFTVIGIVLMAGALAFFTLRKRGSAV